METDPNDPPQSPTEEWVSHYGAGSSELSDAEAERLKLPRMLGMDAVQPTSVHPNPNSTFWSL